MHILIGIGAGVALLYWWLRGHWFARILAFLLFGAAFGLVGGALLPGVATGGELNGLGVIGGIALSWPVAGIPMYIYRRRMNRISGVSMVRYQG